MTPQEFSEALKARGLYRQVDSAEALGISQTAVSRYMAGVHRIPKVVQRALVGIPLLKGSGNRGSSRKVADLSK